MSETEDKSVIFCKHCKRRIHPDDYSGSGFRHEEDWSISCSGTLAEPELAEQQAMLDAELTEQRKTILDDPANTLFGIPMTAVKRLINEKRAEEGDNWWVLERPHITEQRGVTSAKEFYQEHKEFWVIPVDPDNTDPTLVKVHAFAEAYASSRLAEVERTLECGHPQAGRILSSESALSPLICPACRLAEVTAQQ
jgi:hypothetical protein